MDCKVTWMGNTGMTFIAETGTGHIVAMDGALEAGGHNLAPRPMELLLAGTAGCTCFDVVLILKKARQNVHNCHVDIKAERAETDPKIFTRIQFHFTIRGKNIDKHKVDQAIKLSHDKYCSASFMLGKTASLEYTFDIVESED
jgi:putative redox protein